MSVEVDQVDLQRSSIGFKYSISASVLPCLPPENSGWCPTTIFQPAVLAARPLSSQCTERALRRSISKCLRRAPINEKLPLDGVWPTETQWTSILAGPYCGGPTAEAVDQAPRQGPSVFGMLALGVLGQRKRRVGSRQSPERLSGLASAGIEQNPGWTRCVTRLGCRA